MSEDPQDMFDRAAAGLIQQEAGRRTYSVEEIEAAMMKIPRFARAIFLDHVVDGLTYRQIARRRWLTVGCVERQLARALTRLRLALDDIDGRG